MALETEETKETDKSRDPSGSGGSGESTVSTVLTRRGFVIAGGALFVSLVGIRAAFFAKAPATQTPPVHPSPLASWLEIRNDNTILVRTGRAEIGTGMSAFYAQVVAEELSVRPD